MRHCSVILTRSEEHGCVVEVPYLPSCFSQGEAIEEALNHAREAIEGHVEVLAQLGEAIPDEPEPPLLFTLNVNSNLPAPSTTTPGGN